MESIEKISVFPLSFFLSSEKLRRGPVLFSFPFAAFFVYPLHNVQLLQRNVWIFAHWQATGRKRLKGCREGTCENVSVVTTGWWWWQELQFGAYSCLLLIGHSCRGGGSHSGSQPLHMLLHFGEFRSFGIDFSCCLNPLAGGGLHRFLNMSNKSGKEGGCVSDSKIWLTLECMEILYLPVQTLLPLRLGTIECLGS